MCNDDNGGGSKENNEFSTQKTLNNA